MEHLPEDSQVNHPGTSQAQHRLTSLIETSTLTTEPIPNDRESIKTTTLSYPPVNNAGNYCQRTKKVQLTEYAGNHCVH